MHTRVSIRHATDADTPAIARLWSEMARLHERLDPAFAITTDAEEQITTFLREHISSENSVVLVAEPDGTLVGYSLATIAERPPVMANKTFGSIFDVAITKEHRRGGIGEALVRHTEQWFAERGVSRIELRVVVANELADRFWTKMGYSSYLEARYREL